MTDTKPNLAPLRKIVGILRACDSVYDRDMVILECGHEVLSSGIYRARCWRCRKTSEHGQTQNSGGGIQ